MKRFIVIVAFTLLGSPLAALANSVTLAPASRHMAPFIAADYKASGWMDMYDVLFGLSQLTGAQQASAHIIPNFDGETIECTYPKGTGIPGTACAAGVPTWILVYPSHQ